jgi:predicted ATP-binding protein involved in virulence
MLEKIKFEQFTAFDSLEIPFSTGINIFIRANGTGKTHILKTIYATCDITTRQKSLAEKINRVFLPSGEQMVCLIKKSKTPLFGCVWSILIFSKLFLKCLIKLLF